MNRDKSDKSTEDGSAQDDFEKNKTSMKQINNSQVPWAEKAKKLKNSERNIKDVVLLNQEFEKKLKVTTNSQSKEEIRTVSKATHSRWNSIKSKFVSFFVDSFANWFSQPKTNTQ
jgi:GH15 family glucan-1,4-alpha-glucosidase